MENAGLENYGPNSRSGKGGSEPGEKLSSTFHPVLYCSALLFSSSCPSPVFFIAALILFHYYAFGFLVC